MNAWLAALLTTSLLTGCTNRDAADGDKGARTPLPTRQTTIEPVIKKLDTAREDAERRRQQVDDSSK